MNFNWTDDKAIQDAWKERYDSVSTKSTPTNPNYNEIISKYIKKAIDDTKVLIDESDANSRDKLNEFFNEIESELIREIGEIESISDMAERYDHNIDKSQANLNKELSENESLDDSLILKFNRELSSDKQQLKNEYGLNHLERELENNIEIRRLDIIKRFKDVDKASINKIYSNMEQYGVSGFFSNTIINRFNSTMRMLALEDVKDITKHYVDEGEDGGISDNQHLAILFIYFQELAIKIFQDELYQLSRQIPGVGDYQNYWNDNYPKLKIMEQTYGKDRDEYSSDNAISKIETSYKNQYPITAFKLETGRYISNIKKFKLELNNLFGSSEQAVYKKLYEQIDTSDINKYLNQNLILFGVLKSITDKSTNYNKSKINSAGYNIESFKTIGDAKTLSFAYENKYMINLNLPITLQEELNTNNITDSPYIVSTSIPSISLDSIEAKLNNRIVKSLGSMRHDTFGMSFRDTPNRDYYKMFLNWFNICYYKKGSRWKNNIRLYNYPSEYKTTMKVGLLYNHLRQLEDNKEKISEKPYSSGLKLDTNMQWSKISEIDFQLNIDGFYEKLDNTITNVKTSSTTKNEQYKNLQKSGETIEENDTVRQFPIIIEFTHLYPTNIGDLQMQSTSTELLTFDVTFEYSNPIKYWIINLDGSYSLYEL